MARKENEAPTMGDNSGADEQLQDYVRRIESVRIDLASLKDDEKDIFAEAKAAGFDAKILRKVMRIREMDQQKRAEEEAMIELYLTALGLD